MPSGGLSVTAAPSRGGGVPPVPSERSEWLGVDALAACDLVVTPGLSVDAARHAARARAAAATTGPCATATRPRPVVTLLHEGEASEVDLPADEHDLPVDAYVTTTGRLVRVG